MESFEGRLYLNDELLAEGVKGHIHEDVKIQINEGDEGDAPFWIGAISAPPGVLSKVLDHRLCLLLETSDGFKINILIDIKSIALDPIDGRESAAFVNHGAPIK